MSRGATASRLRVPGHAVRVLAFFMALVAATAARADEKEIYTLVGYVPTVQRYDLPANGAGSATDFANALDLTAYYGLTNTIHVGARLRGTISSDVHLADVRVNLPDGSVSPGDAYLDHLAVALSALALYRFDTGLHLAPMLEVEAGFSSHQYRRIAHVPAGVAFTIPLADVSETVFRAASALLLEYRFGNRWVASGGVGVQVEPSSHAPWAVLVPLRVGAVW